MSQPGRFGPWPWQGVTAGTPPGHWLGRRRALAGLLVVMLAVLAACATPGPEGVDTELSDQPLTGKFVWHDLITDDVDGARRFYGTLFGWRFHSTERLGAPYTLITHKGRYVGGIVRLEDPEGPEDYSRWLGYLSVSDVDRASALAVEQGGALLVAPLDIEDVARAAAVRDPQGAVLGLLRIRGGDPVDHVDLSAGEVVWNELLAADPEMAARFYAELAGLSAEHVERRGGAYTLLNSGSQSRAGVLRRPNENIQPQWLTHFAVADPATAARRAEALGGRILLAPSAEIREGGMALIEDPSGALMALHRWPEGG